MVSPFLTQGSLNAGTCTTILDEVDLRLDRAKNAESPLDEDIAALDATVRILVIHAQEDWMIAQERWNLVRTATTSMGH